MSEKSHIYLINIIICFLGTSCIEPYSPRLDGYNSLLVVEGMITDANRAYAITLSRTFPDQFGTAPKINDASVSVSDSKSNIYVLHNQGNGQYVTDSTVFRGVAGETYTLHVIMADGSEYQSDPCTMMPVSDIDSIYFLKDQQFMKNGTESFEGISIYLDAKATASAPYYRWSFEETWKFKVPYPVYLRYINDTTIVPVPIKNIYCWKSNISYQILIQEADPLKSWKLKKIPVLFIPSGESDRLMMEYSVLVKQYSLSLEEYKFWNNIQKVNQSGNDIFASLPYSVSSNIHNIARQGERVLGYFQVSAMKQKRKFIYFNEIAKTGIPYYNSECQLYIPDPDKLMMSLGQINSAFLRDSIYSLADVVYYPGSSHVYRLVFTTTACSICVKTGSSRRPDFWKD